MGYYTHYSLEVKLMGVGGVKSPNDLLMELLSECSTDQERLKVIRENSALLTAEPMNIIQVLRNENEEANYVLNDDGTEAQAGKWYSHNSDMKEFSKQHPQWLFILSGEGEESEDMWREYYIDGKVQVAKAIITFDEFDPKKLGD